MKNKKNKIHRKILKILAIALIIGFNISTISCRSIPPREGVEWSMPSEPQTLPLQSIIIRRGETFTFPSDGLFFDSINSSNLWHNINELDAFIEKQDALIREMKRYYRAK